MSFHWSHKNSSGRVTVDTRARGYSVHNVDTSGFGVLIQLPVAEARALAHQLAKEFNISNPPPEVVLPPTATLECPRCDGSGETVGAIAGRHPCPACQATGEITGKTKC